MGRKIPRRYIYDFQWTPVDVATGATRELLRVNAGDRVLAVSARVRVASAGTTATVSFGDGADPDGYIIATDLDATVAGTLVDGGGAYLANSGGKLYTAADTIDAVYVTGATPGATAPVWEVRVTVVKGEW